MKLVKLINAASAITKIIQSDDLSASYVWELLDFAEQAKTESDRFEKMRLKVVKENTKEKDGEQAIHIASYNLALDELFSKEIELDCSVLDLEEIKKVEGLSVSDVMAIKELLSE